MQISLSPVGDFTYLRQHLVLMMWINVLVNWAENTDTVIMRHASGCELPFSGVKGCFTHPLGHAAFIIVHPIDCYERKHKPTGIVPQPWVDTAFKQLPEDFAKGWPKWFFHSLVPSIMPQWVMPLVIAPLAKHNRVTPAQLFLVVMLS